MPSNSRKPADQLWSDHSNMVAKFSELCARQIDAGMGEARHEITCLSESLLRIADELNQLVASSNTIQRSADNDQTRQSLEAVSTSLNLALAKLQFADRLNQRVSNVRNNLLQLSAQVSLPTPTIAEDSWDEFLHRVRDNFTLEDERLMFDSVMRNLPEELISDKTIIPELFDGGLADEH